jgi:hypothetical protein
VRALPLLGGGSLALLLAAAACDDATKPPFLPEASPTATAGATPTAPATPTPTAVPEAAGMAGFRAFAVQIEAAVEARDVDFFLSNAQISTTSCPNDFEPRCQGLPDGATVEGIWLGKWRSHAFLLTPEDFHANLTDYFASLPEPTLIAIAGLERVVGGVIGGPASFAIVGAPDDSTQSTIFQFVSINGTWRFKLTGGGGQEWLSGDCADCYYDTWEPWTGASP